jgi:phage protein D/phage baseplate assembly protein gpV
MNPAFGLSQIVVEADGQALPPEDVRRLGKVRVQQRLSLPVLCELAFFEGEQRSCEVPSLSPGAQLRITVAGHDDALFAGEVTAIEYVCSANQGRELRVRGYDKLHRMRKRSNVRGHVQVSLEELVKNLVGESDIGATVKLPSGAPQWRRLIQRGQSDFEFLEELAEQCGLYFTLRDGTLQLLTLEGIGEPESLVLGDSLFEARIEVNGEPACRSVTASGWDLLRAEPIKQTAASARSGRTARAEAPPGKFNGKPERRLVNAPVEDEAHVEGMAQAELDRRIASEVTLSGVAEGNPALRPGTVVEVRNVPQSVAGQYVLTEVTHILDTRVGFVSEISTKPAAPKPRHAHGTAMALGVVTRVDDPDSYGRVCASLPAYDDVETDWMGVVTAGAGSGKGMIALPSVGDKVLVLFPHENPAQGVVVGGLFGAKQVSDSGVEGGSVQRYTFITPGGQRIRLDDNVRSVRIENSEGSSIEFSPQSFVIHAAGQLAIESPGGTISIKAAKINFEEG